jgi:hypothetical protein
MQVSLIEGGTMDLIQREMVCKSIEVMLATSYKEYQYFKERGIENNKEIFNLLPHFRKVLGEKFRYVKKGTIDLNLNFRGFTIIHDEDLNEVRVYWSEGVDRSENPYKPVTTDDIFETIGGPN